MSALAENKAGAIVAEHEAAQASMRSAVVHAIRAGELLIEAKAGIPHGDFGEFCKALPFSDRTGRGYMRLARLDAEERQRVADMSLREALEAIAETKREPIEPPSRDASQALAPEAIAAPMGAQVANPVAHAELLDRLAHEVRATRELEHDLAQARRNLDAGSRADAAWRPIHLALAGLHARILKARKLPPMPKHARAEVAAFWPAVAGFFAEHRQAIADGVRATGEILLKVKFDKLEVCAEGIWAHMPIDVLERFIQELEKGLRIRKREAGYKAGR